MVTQWYIEQTFGERVIVIPKLKDGTSLRPEEAGISS
jgi:hypothetical protein